MTKPTFVKCLLAGLLTLCGMTATAQDNNVDESDSIHKRVLIFGDSTLDGVARRFADYARENNFSLYSAVWYGATVNDWAWTTELPRLMKSVNPNYVIISLGTNDLGYHDLSARAKAVREIVHEVGNVPFVWIGPISLKVIKKDPGVAAMIRENVGADRFYDSYHLKLARLGDGIHPTFAASATWVDSVARWMAGSRQPLLLSKPTGKAQSFKHNERHTQKYKGKRKELPKE